MTEVTQIKEDPVIVEIHEDETSAELVLAQALEVLSLAKQWAAAPEDQKVLDNLYSSLHYNSKTLELYNQFSTDRIELNIDSANLNRILILVEKLTNELPGIEIQPGYYSAKHYLKQMQDIQVGTYSKFNGFSALVDQVNIAVSIITNLVNLAKAYATADSNTPVEGSLFSARKYALESSQNLQSVITVRGEFENTYRKVLDLLSGTIDEQLQNLLMVADKVTTDSAKAASSASLTSASENKAKTSEINSKTSETNSKTSETNAKGSETNSASSATIAVSAANRANTSEVNSAKSLQDIQIFVTISNQNATNAANSATDAQIAANAAANAGKTLPGRLLFLYS